MNLQHLLSQLSNPNTPETPQGNSSTSPLDSIKSAIPGGLAGGAAAGGIMALLLGSKKGRKMAGTAVKYGGTAILGGLAFKAFENWKQNQAIAQAQPATLADLDKAEQLIPDNTSSSTPLNLLLVKTMISAAKADGHLDADEQKGIFDAVERMNLDADDKVAVFDAMSRDIPVHELASAVTRDEHRAEAYLSAFLAIDVDHEKERAYLDSLAQALALPEGLPEYLEQQAKVSL